MKSKSHQKSAANKFRWFYDKCRTELFVLEPDINKLLDMLVIIYYGDKKNGAEFLGLEKDILWNAFPNEMIARCADKNITTNIDFAELKKRHMQNVEYQKKQKNRKSNKKKVVITSIEKSHKDKCVMLTKEDRKCIDKYVNDAYKDKLIKRRDNVFKIKRVLAMLVYLSRKCEKDDGTTQWIKKLNNVPNEITDLTLERLTGVSHKNMDACIALFERLGIVQSKIFCGGTKIKVLFPYHHGQVWIETADYNKAGTMIRDYFRLETNFREILPKIS